MPAQTETTVNAASRFNIGKAYSAFDDDCHALFRRAMRESRGGTVRIEDLVRALADSAAGDLGRCVLPLPTISARLIPRGADPTGLTPMTNEPDLRRLLQVAWQIGLAQPQTDQYSINPRVLCCALVAVRPQWFDAELDPFQALLLARPPELPVSPRRPPPLLAAPASPQALHQLTNQSLPVQRSIEVGPAIRTVLHEWAAIQNTVDLTDKRAAIADLVDRTRRIVEASTASERC
jgi:hypothetical protein